MAEEVASLFAKLSLRDEEFIRGRISEILAELESRQAVKGEITLLVGSGSIQKAAGPSAVRDMIISGLKSKTGSASTLAREISKKCGVPRQTVYDMILEIKDQKKDDPI